MKNFVAKIFFCIVSLIFLQGCGPHVVHSAPSDPFGHKFMSHDGEIFKTALETDKYYNETISKMLQSDPPTKNILEDCIKVPFVVLEEIYWSISPYIINDSGWEFPYNAEHARASAKKTREEKRAPSVEAQNSWELVKWEEWAKWRGIYDEKTKKIKRSEGVVTIYIY